MAYSMSNRVHIDYTMYGYLKLLTILEAVENRMLPPEEMQRDVSGLLRLLRNIPPMQEGPQ
jgi:hypothetical protein